MSKEGGGVTAGSRPSFDVVFVDENPAVIAELAARFRGCYADSVRFVVGNVFQQGPGILVSPANSRGDMGGGFDLQLTCRFGSRLEVELQSLIAYEHGGLLPIGTAVSLATSDSDYPYVIFTPTVKSHMNVVRHPADVRKAASAAFGIADKVTKENALHPNSRVVLMPGLGTGARVLPLT